LACTEDRCDDDVGGTGLCLYQPILCPISNNNCTLNFCLYGGCDSRSLCPDNLIQEPLAPGFVALIVIAVAVGLAGLAGSGYVILMIRRAPKKEKHGGKVEDFAAD
jgi:hypothetical protein